MKKVQLFKRNPDYVFRKIVDEYVLVPVHQNVVNMECIYTLNDVGALLWEGLAAPVSLAKLAEAVMNDFEVDHDTVQRDLHDFITEMETCGAVLKVTEE